MHTSGRHFALIRWDVPAPHPDELGYSVVARYLDQWGRMDPEGLLHQALQRRVLSIHPLLPPCVPALAERTRGAVASSDDFVRLHTLLPYHLAFEHAFKRRMIWRDIDERASVSVWRIDPPYAARPQQWMRLCHHCVFEQRQQQGECYWRRSHQLPGLSRCTDHRTTLRDSAIAFATDHVRHCTSLASLLTRAGALPATRAQFAMSLERRIAHRSVAALKASPFTEVSRGSSPEFYRLRLIQGGFGGRSGELRTTELEKALAAWLARHRSALQMLGSRHWWLRLITGIGGRTTTLQHLILKEFLVDHGIPA